MAAADTLAPRPPGISTQDWDEWRKCLEEGRLSPLEETEKAHALMLRYSPTSMPSLGKGGYTDGVMLCKDLAERRFVVAKPSKAKPGYYRAALFAEEFARKSEDIDGITPILAAYNTGMFKRMLILPLHKGGSIFTSHISKLKEDEFPSFSIDDLEAYSRQGAGTLKELEKRGLVLGDIKCENAYVVDGKLYFADFDFGYVEGERHFLVTETIMNRSPHVILQSRYNHLNDRWAFGCMLFKMYTGLDLFPSSASSKDMQSMSEQLDQIQKELGPIPASVIESGDLGSEFFEKVTLDDGREEYKLKRVSREAVEFKDAIFATIERAALAKGDDVNKARCFAHLIRNCFVTYDEEVSIDDVLDHPFIKEEITTDGVKDFCVDIMPTSPGAPKSMFIYKRIDDDAVCDDATAIYFQTLSHLKEIGRFSCKVEDGVDYVAQLRFGGGVTQTIPVDLSKRYFVIKKTEDSDTWKID
jgi:serine/threonine protein kinase